MSSSSALPAHRLSTVAWTLLGLSLLWALVWFFHAFHYWEDDAYIHLEFARSLTRGQGFSFNGHIVYGDTSPLWVYLLIAFHGLVPSWIVAGKVLALCGVVLSAAGSFFLGRKLTGDILFAAAMVLLFVFNPYFVFWAYSGMETITAAGVAFWGAVIVSNRIITWPRFLVGCLIVGIGPVTRPEMAFLSAILAVVLLVRWVQQPVSFTTKLPAFVAGLMLAVGPTLAWSLYALHHFGMLVPNTNAAKRALPKDSIPVRLVSVYALGYPVLLCCALTGVGYLILRLMRKQPNGLRSYKHLPVGGWVFIVWTAITSIFYVANHTYVQTRYVFVSASGLLITVLAALYLWFPRLLRPAIVLTASISFTLSLGSTWLFIRNKVEADRINDVIALWMRDNLPPQAPVAMFNIGQLAYVSEHPIIDVGGITRPSVIPFLSDPDAVQRWAYREGAAYSLTESSPMPGSTLVYSIEQPNTGWYLNPRHYRERVLFNLWKLPTAIPGTGAPEPSVP